MDTIAAAFVSFGDINSHTGSDPAVRAEGGDPTAVPS
jgi:hypothetical protein